MTFRWVVWWENVMKSDGKCKVSNEEENLRKNQVKFLVNAPENVWSFPRENRSIKNPFHFNDFLIKLCFKV